MFISFIMNISLKFMEKVVIALGGNALLEEKDARTYDVQYEHARNTFISIDEIIDKNKAVITHGNGPQVGDILLSQEVSGMHAPLHQCVAMSQGSIAEVLVNAYESISSKPGKTLSAILTRVIVDKNDSAFKNPTKPIGRTYEKKEVAALRRKGWIIRNTDEGWRRVAPSPKPIKIVELDAIEALMDLGYVPICIGGGGIPVVKKGNKLVGVDAVIDKDMASALLASSIKATTLMILTDVDYAYKNYEKERQEKIEKADANAMQEYLNEGQFEEGSMKPKVEAALSFIKNGGKRAIITSLGKAKLAFNEKYGTIIEK